MCARSWANASAWSVGTTFGEGVLRKAPGSDLSVGSPPVLDRIVGQPRVRAVLGSFVASPVHAFFFVGPPGSGKREAARAFAAALVCPHGG